MKGRVCKMALIKEKLNIDKNKQAEIKGKIVSFLINCSYHKDNN
jgi:hypothetical protein